MLDDKWKAAKDDLAALQATSDENDASLAKLADVANAGDQINTVCDDDDALSLRMRLSGPQPTPDHINHCDDGVSLVHLFGFQAALARLLSAIFMIRLSLRTRVPLLLQVVSALKTTYFFDDSVPVLRWAYFHTYQQRSSWFIGNEVDLYGGINPSTWTDGNAMA